MKTVNKKELKSVAGGSGALELTNILGSRGLTNIIPVIKPHGIKCIKNGVIGDSTCKDDCQCTDNHCNCVCQCDPE